MFFIRLPIDHVGAVLEFGEEVRCLVEVVGEVGVGHQDVLAARCGETGQVGAAVAALGLVDDVRAGGLRPAARCRRSEPLSATITSPSMPFAVERVARARGTHSSIVPASFRHGITIESRTGATSMLAAGGSGGSGGSGGTVGTGGSARTCARSGSPEVPERGGAAAPVPTAEAPRHPAKSTPMGVPANATKG